MDLPNFKIGDLVVHNLDFAAAEIDQRPPRIWEILDMTPMNPQGYINIEIACLDSSGVRGMVTHQFALRPATEAEITLYHKKLDKI